MNKWHIQMFRFSLCCNAANKACAAIKAAQCVEFMAGAHRVFADVRQLDSCAPRHKHHALRALFQGPTDPRALISCKTWRSAFEPR